MTKQLRKIFSILCALALLVSSLATVLAEETVPVEENAANIAAEEETVQNADGEEAARKAAEEEAARKAAEEEAARKAAEEEAARKAAEEEAARKADEEADLQDVESENASQNAEEGTDILTEAEETAEEGADDQEEAADVDETTETENPDPAESETAEDDTADLTDETKTQRSAEITVGQMLSDTVGEDEELTITLKTGSESALELKLYVESGYALKIKVDGKAAGFPPAGSDIPSMDLYTFELANAEGPSHEIVLTSDHTVSIQFTAAGKNPEEAGADEANEENNQTPADENTDENPSAGGSSAVESPAEVPAHTIQVSVKTYGALKAGRRISDSLVAGQKAKIQLKCGKTPYITLTLDADLNDMVVTINGSKAELAAAGNGTYTYELNNVAFRKYNIVIFAKKDLSFTLSAEANGKPDEDTQAAEITQAEEPAEAAEEEPAEGNAEAAEEEPAEENTEAVEEEAAEENAEAAAEEPAEENTEAAAEEPAEENAEAAVEEPAEENTESATEEPAEENTEAVAEEAAEEEPAAEEPAEENTETAAEEPAEENTEAAEEEAAEEDAEETADESGEETEEESAEDAEEAEEAEESDPEDENEKMAALGFIRVRITAEEGADLYADADRESEVVGHLDAETEVWVILNEEQTWGQIYSEDEEEAARFISMEDAAVAADEEPADEEPAEEGLSDEQLIELGYYQVQILNRNGADVYDSTAEEAAVIGHIEPESEIWVKDAETEGWAEIYTTEEETQQFIRLDEIGKQMPTDEEMLEMGYIKGVVALDIGANVYDSPDGDNVIGHLDADTEIWIRLIDHAERAEIYSIDEEEAPRYIALVDVIAILKPDDMGELPTRELVIHSSAEGMDLIFVGTMIRFETELINFQESDIYTVQWKYSLDGEVFTDIANANDLNYEFAVDMENAEYIWKVSVILKTA